MNEPIIIKTTIKKEDYRKFLYIATFRKSPYTLLMIAFISFLGSALLNLTDKYSWQLFISHWIFLYIAALCAVCIKLEIIKKRRIKSDKIQTYESENILEFYDDKVIIKNEYLKSVIEIEYSRFFKLLECNDYFIFYMTYNQATLLRKKDIDDLKEFKSFIKEKFQGNYKSIFYFNKIS